MTMTSWDRLYQTGTLGDALLYASLFWPMFVEHDGMVLLAEEVATQPDLADLDAVLQAFAGDHTAVERAYNLVEVPILFAASDDPDSAAPEMLARTLRAMWEAKLSQDFPGWQFAVEVLEGGVDDPTIRFHRAR